MNNKPTNRPALPKLNVKFDVKNINPRIALDIAMAVILVVLYALLNQTTVAVLAELALVACIIVADRQIARAQRVIKNDSLLQHAGIVLTLAADYVNAAIDDLRQAEDQRDLRAACNALLHLREAVVTTPSALGDFIALFLHSLTGNPETVDTTQIAKWSDVDALEFGGLNTFETYWTSLHSSATLLLRAAAGIGSDLKTIEKRSSSFEAALNNLSRFNPPQKSLTTP